MKRAFTLIELLVVIAIIAILAAILFPVFAQAKAAAKASVALSNNKQLALARMMYSNDFEDSVVRSWIQQIEYNPNGTFKAVTDEVNWKRMLNPYIKSMDLYKDPMNPAVKFPDYRSNPVNRARWNWTPTELPASEKTFRGYTLANLWHPGLGQFQDARPDGNFTTTEFTEPAKIFAIVEAKIADEMIYPGASWVQNFDTATGLQWNWGGDKWSNKAMVVAYQDGHAGRMAHSKWCGEDYSTFPDGSSQVDYWNLPATQKVPRGWIHTQGCGSMPTQFR